MATAGRFQKQALHDASCKALRNPNRISKNTPILRAQRPTVAVAETAEEGMTSERAGAPTLRFLVCLYNSMKYNGDQYCFLAIYL